MRIVLATALALVIAVLAAACGSDEQSAAEPTASVPTTITNTIYERAYSECSSTKLENLAGKYHVAQPTVDNVARAVGAAWADRYSAGQEGQQIGESACQDGIATNPDASTSA